VQAGCFPDFKLGDIGSKVVVEWTKGGQAFTMNHTLAEAATQYVGELTALADTGVDLNVKICLNDVPYVSTILDFLNVGNCASAHGSVHVVKNQARPSLSRRMHERFACCRRRNWYPQLTRGCLNRVPAGWHGREDWLWRDLCGAEGPRAVR
jgi:hypothetical protein